MLEDRAFSGEVDPVHRRKCGWGELHFQVKWIRFTVENAAYRRVRADSV
jgi:hypothetical protein